MKPLNRLALDIRFGTAALVGLIGAIGLSVIPALQLGVTTPR
ncbi:MAG TPA: hypothetical protein VF148_02640 [Acidimicrobiia bacterium]